MVKCNFKVNSVRLKLFLDTKSPSLASSLSLQRGGQRIHSTLMVFPGVIEFLNLLKDLAINLLSNLAKLKLSPKDFVFPFHNVKLLSGFIPCSLESEQFTVIIATFLVAGFSFRSKIIHFGLPFSNDLVKVSAPLFSDNGSSVNTLIL